MPRRPRAAASSSGDGQGVATVGRLAGRRQVVLEVDERRPGDVGGGERVPTGPPVEVPAHVGQDDLVTVGEHPAGVDDRGELHRTVTLPPPVPAQAEWKASS